MDQAERLRNIIKSVEKPSNNLPELARVITVTSGKGGVGKTSISVNLAIQLSRFGKKVVILDADFGLANIEVMLGIRPEYNLADMMFQKKSLTDIIFYGPENIGFISGGSGINELSNMTKEQLYSLVQKLHELDSLADYIIIDTGAGIADSVLEFVAASTEVLLIATPEPTSITDAYALLKSLNRNSSYMPEKTVVKLIANQIRSSKDGQELYDKLSIVVNKFLNIDVDFFGTIPYDSNMQKAIMKQNPVCLLSPNSISAESLRKITHKLINTQIENNMGIMQIFTRVIRMKLRRF